ncbi:MAG: S41 family peptidase [Bacillota bacterium]
MSTPKTLHKNLALHLLLSRLCLSFILVLVLSCNPFSRQAATANEDTRLREIAEQMEKYYLFAPEEGVELHSLDELPLLWQDPHSTYLKEEQFRLFTESLDRSLTGIGVYLEKGRSAAVTVVSTVPESPACRAGLLSGDLIVSVDGRLVLDSPLEKVVSLLRGEEGTAVKLLVRRGEQLLTFSLIRERILLPAVEQAVLPGELLLLRLYNFGGGAATEMSRYLNALDREGVRGIILDLRANQGGYVDEALALAALFTDGPLLQVREKGTDWQVINGRDSKVTSLPLVALVNRGTASGAEIVAAALKDNGAALLVGENTFGKGTMQTIVSLSYGGYLKMTTAEFASPRRTLIEGTGIEPHFLVPDPREQEERAVELLRYLLEQQEGKESYLELYLQQYEAKMASLPPILRDVQGEDYYPLRKLLALTGRTILAGTKPGVYSFIWEGHCYELDLNEKLLSGPALPATEDGVPVLLRQGITYVPLSFLERGLKLPFLH